MKKSCCQCFLDVCAIAHCKRSCSIHNADRMFKTFFLEFFRQIFADLEKFFCHNGQILLCSDLTLL